MFINKLCFCWNKNGCGTKDFYNTYENNKHSAFHAFHFIFISKHKIKQKIETLLEIKIKFGNWIKRDRAMRHSIQNYAKKLRLGKSCWGIVGFLSWWCRTKSYCDRRGLRPARVSLLACSGTGVRRTNTMGLHHCMRRCMHKPLYAS